MLKKTKNRPWSGIDLLLFFPLLVLQPSSILTTKTENENAVAFEEGSNLLNVEFGIEGRKKFVLF